MDEQQSRQTIASLRHFLRKLCPPLLLTIVHTNGSSKQATTFHSSKNSFDFDDDDEDSAAEQLMLSMLKKCLNTSEANDTLIKFASTADIPVLLVELYENEVKLSVDVKMQSKLQSRVALIKSIAAPIDPSKPIASQVQTTSMAMDPTADGESLNQTFFGQLLQLTRNFYTPLARSAKTSGLGQQGEVSDQDNQILVLQKKIRDLDTALEQCQQGSQVPNIVLVTPNILQDIASTLDPSQLRNYNDKFNASVVDNFFSEIKLNELMGDTDERRDTFVGDVNKVTKQWPVEITRQVKSIDIPFPGSVEKEVNFWQDVTKKLEETREQLESPPQLLTRLFLKLKLKSLSYQIQESELSLTNAIRLSQVSITFLKDFPVDDLHKASNLHPQLSRAVHNSLHFFSRLKHSNYDFNRAIRLLEVLKEMVSERIVTFLKEKDILRCPVEEVHGISESADEVFRNWKIELSTQRSSLKVIATQRHEKVGPLKFDLDPLQKRVHAIVEFREQHEKMLSVLSVVLEQQQGEGNYVSELNSCYQLILTSNPDFFDITPTGATAWANSVQLYEKRMEKVEEHITRTLGELLTAAKSADEMFRIFSLFNPLFFRPTIKNAVHSYRSVLVKSVREDVRKLQEKFKLKYDESHERILADLRDIPPLSGRIIWARQIENQLVASMKRIQDVLGMGWEDQPEGKSLKEVCDELRSYLDVSQIYEEWLSVQLKTDYSKYNKLKDFLLLVEEDPRDLKKHLKVNFDNKLVIVFKEVKYLEWLLPNMNMAHKTIPHTIKARATEAYGRYPIALALQSALAGFAQAKKKINDSNSILLNSHLQTVREVVREALGGSKRQSKWIKWDAKELHEWVSHLSNKIFSLQERVEELTETLLKVDDLLDQLKHCQYDSASMNDIMFYLQTIVDEMPTKGFSNIAVWVSDLDKRIEQVLKDRLNRSIMAWVSAFNKVEKAGKQATAAPAPPAPVKKETSMEARLANLSGKDQNGNAKKDKQQAAEYFPADEVTLESTTYEIVIANQVLFLTPPLEDARVYWTNAFHTHISIALCLSRIQSGRLQVFQKANTGPQDYGNILLLLGKDLLKQPYYAIANKLQQASAYVHNWLQYQALWDANVVNIAEQLGRNSGEWQQLLNEMRDARTEVENTEEYKSFGPIKISNRQVQNKVNLKYDAWQKEAQLRYGIIILEDIKAIHSELVASKNRLEAISLDGNTRDVIAGVEFVMKTQKSMHSFEEKINELKEAEKLLQSQRFQFPANWCPMNNVLSTFQDMCIIQGKRKLAMETQLPGLQEKLREEDTIVKARSEKFMEAWSREKPVAGNLSAAEVIASLDLFTTSMKNLYEETSRVRTAKEALGMEYTSEEVLAAVQVEMTDLRDAWVAVAPLHDKLASIGSVLMKDFNPVKTRKELEDLNNESRNLPAKIRSYAAVEYLQDKITKHISYQPIIRDLSGETLKERHWKKLLDKLQIQNMTMQTVTLTAIWDANPAMHKIAIIDSLQTASGEVALEEFLKSVKEHWVKEQLELVARDTVKIVINWDVQFTQMDDHLNNLNSLKQSPFFKNVPEFQEETTNWESKLTTLRQIFDAWLEVQRKWVYLRGIFKNGDIKKQLPTQDKKFAEVDKEYVALMKRVSAKPFVLEVLQFDNMLKNLERQDGTMALIQKALGEYLEKQRQLFPRFYFVNNDDLVEIIGNNNEPSKIIVHFAKMFSALTTITMKPSGAPPPNENSPPPMVALEMGSKEGEIVPFASKVDCAVGVKDWLTAAEAQMAISLATLLDIAVNIIPTTDSKLMEWVDKYPAQVVMLAIQVNWSRNIENALTNSTLPELLSTLEVTLRSMSENVLQDMDPPLRKKCEQLLTEMVHQRDVTRLLISTSVPSKSDFGWVYHLRFYFDPKEANIMQRLSVKMANASFFYGFEYLGISERLVHTPLTDRCYLTLTQALHFGLGGNPFGPAGTGKTESVKMLGAQLGRFVLVFNCDKSFDYAAMGRIFAGLCQVGAWGCFDEFNRLEERILSACSQQILGIQKGMLAKLPSIELMGNPCKLNRDVGIFITMNPGYAGRSNLPDNLKQLFRAVAMAVPDRKLIAQVMLFSQGIVTAEDLAGKIVLLFTLCEEQLSAQSHYDFGLRALKSVLVGAGELKRNAVNIAKKGSTGDEAAATAASDSNMEETEKKVLIEATCGSIVPKLVSDDIPLFNALLQAVFPGSELPIVDDEKLIEELKKICLEDNLEFQGAWAEKVMQLKALLDVRHGVMLVGPTGTGKTAAWKTLLKALQRVDKAAADFYVIDPKSITLEGLYGKLDANTGEWTDGIFTFLLRKVSDGSTKALRRSWILFDGDVDPEWAENLNSVLDDNKLLTLPSGDRLKIPPNVRIMMETDSLRHATLATVSRAGMVWFAADTLSLDMVLRQQLVALRKDNTIQSVVNTYGKGLPDHHKRTQEKFVDAVVDMYTPSPGIVGLALDYVMTQSHVMEITVCGVLSTLYKMMKRGIVEAVNYNEENSDDPMSDAHLNKFAIKWLLYSTLWAFGGSMNVSKRYILSDVITSNYDCELPSKDLKLLDLAADAKTGNWVEWNTMIPQIEIEAHQVSATNVVVQTTDTVRHVEVIRAWLESHKPLILCGPPGSGKSMTLTSVLDTSPEYILAALNFSAGTNPDLILTTFLQYCEEVEGPENPGGKILQPQSGTYQKHQWLVVFCDECNLPADDLYGTQAVITFLRQMVEQGGYWNSDNKWVMLRRIQFVGAANPPTDAGRVVLSNRFLRWAPVLLVDYPVEESMKQIYRVFNQGLLKLHKHLMDLLDPLNNAMVIFYLRNQERFTPDIAPQYIYSPRELSRWTRAMFEAMEPMSKDNEAMSPEELVTLWGHEALRLFHDRCITHEERDWVQKLVDSVAETFFAPKGVDTVKCLQRPLLYSKWITGKYIQTGRADLKVFVSERLKRFYDEELDVKLVIFDDVLDHVLRIDNVLSHPMGHLLLVGESGVGKTVLTKFVAWMNNLKIYQIKANSRYTVEQFDDDLRVLFKRVGIDSEKICFIFDESNALSSAFLERMNSLLASGEIPGLFEGDERVQLMAGIRDSFSKKKGEVILDTDDELQRQFTKLIQRNLHVCFTMNPAGGDFAGRSNTSPALFNRCVVDWFGTWSFDALTQVAHEFTRNIDTGFNQYSGPPDSSKAEVLQKVAEVMQIQDIGLQEAVVAALVSMHESAKKMTIRVGKLTGRQHYLSPRDFLDFINKFLDTENEKRSALQEKATHIRTGLTKLLETEQKVKEMQEDCKIQGEVLKHKEEEANENLNKMVATQNDAEQKKARAKELTIELAEQNEQISHRKVAVETELSEAEPTLNAAKAALSGIKKAQLDEVKGFAKPTQPVLVTMQMVCIMQGEKNVTEWGDLKKAVAKSDFIPSLLNFDPNKLSDKTIKDIEDKFLSRTDLNCDIVNAASKACGPLYQWCGSLIKYAKILKNIKPLRDEVAALVQKSDELEVGRQEAVKNVGILENMISELKANYAVAIRETEEIRSKTAIVTKRVASASSLLSSLEDEKVRWAATSQSFDEQMSTLIGDNLIAAGFLTYGGIFDQKVRKRMTNEWAECLEDLGIPFRADMEIIPYLSNSQDHLQWRDWGLPMDDLAVQNAILLQRFKRFPLMVDPSGQATNFITNKYASKKMLVTSFVDNNFMKTLASAIRLGTPLMVQDVETIDPVLNPILNREFQKTGGRTLVHIGNEAVDFSPVFVVFLITRNPYARFNPDLCSRVTMINFTVTPNSLQSQALSAVLKAERPDVDNRRNEVLKMQGEQAAKMKDLEDQLLNKISSVQGNILDDDSVIKTLERIKGEAKQLNLAIEQTKEILEEVKTVSNLYVPLAAVMTAVYFSLEGLSDIYFLYQYSLQFLFEVMEKVLTSSKAELSTDVSAAKERLKYLKQFFFSEITRRVLRGLKFEDKLMFIVRLAQISTQESPQMQLNDQEIDLLLKGGAPIISESSNTIIQKLKDSLPDQRIDEACAKRILALSLVPAFSNIVQTLSTEQAQWIEFMDHEAPEENMPVKWIKAGSGGPDPAERLKLLQVIVIKTMRPDRQLYALELFITTVFGENFDWRDLSKVNLREIVEKDSKSKSPMMLCSEAGQDASGKVDALSTEMNQKLVQVSMGSAEGYVQADAGIGLAAKSGFWVLLRNVHLCSDWLAVLEKRLSAMPCHDKFRLFLTCELHPKLPLPLLRVSEVIVFEASTGIKANIQRFYNSVPAARIDRQPAERVRMYGLLAWFNAVVQERLRYTPIGFTKKHEFTEADSNVSLDVIDQWIDNVAGARAHINPNEIPWSALQKLLSESLYGGRVDHPFDQLALDGFIQFTFNARNYASDAALATDHEGRALVKLPDSLGRPALEKWIKELPDSNPPSWIGLPVTAEGQLKMIMAQKILTNLSILYGSAGDDGDAASDGGGNRYLTELVDRWLATLPSVSSLPEVSPEQTSDASALPMERYIAREVTKGRNIINFVTKEIKLVKALLLGEVKITNHLRELMTCFQKGQIPKKWKTLYIVSSRMGLSTWIADLAARGNAMDKYSDVLNKSSSESVTVSKINALKFWIGGMFLPEGLITATRQNAAQVNRWSLEDLELFLELGGSSTSESSQETVVEGLLLEGAKWANGSLQLSDELRCSLPPCKLKWQLKGQRKGVVVSFPVYLHDGRTSLIVQVLVSSPPSVPPLVWAQRGVGVILQVPV